MADERFGDRRLQELYREVMQHPDRGRHLDESTWDRLAMGEIAGEERDTLFDHIVGCAQCSHTWRGVIALKEQAGAEGLLEAPAVKTMSLMRSSVPLLALAASLVLVVGGLLINRSAVRTTTDTLRGESLEAIEGLNAAPRSGAVVLRWNAVGGASQYRVSVFTEDGRPAWSRETTDHTVTWPADSPAAAGRYQWRVEALTDNRVVARSRVTDLEVQ